MLLGYYSRGHHDPELFLAACRAEFEDFDANVGPAPVVQHVYYRNELWGVVNNYEPTHLMMKRPAGKGSYPVTEVEIHQ